MCIRHRMLSSRGIMFESTLVIEGIEWFREAFPNLTLSVFEGGNCGNTYAAVGANFSVHFSVGCFPCY